MSQAVHIGSLAVTNFDRLEYEALHQPIKLTVPSR
jgi:hypothetical protein